MESLLEPLKGVPIVVQAIIGSLILGVIYNLVTGVRPYAGFPVAQLDEKRWLVWLLPHLSWMLFPTKILAKGKSISNESGIYQVRSAAGYKLVLPRRFADELRGHKDLDLAAFNSREWHNWQPGFEAFREGLRPDGFLIDVIRTKLTPIIGLLTNDLVVEAQHSISEWFGSASKEEWKTVEIKQAILDIVARVSTRVFAGEEMARNKEYIKLAKDNTVAIFTAAAILYNVPAFLRHLAVWTLPQCRALRVQVADAKRLLGPKVQETEQRRREAAMTGEKPSKKTLDSFSWMVDAAKGRKINFVEGQMTLSMSAIHTTTEMTTRAMMQCCNTPEIIDELREEMIRVLKEEGWEKTAFYKMKLLDSFMSEVSRHHRMLRVGMGRCVMNEVILSDGTVLPKDTLIMIENDGPCDPEVYPEPEKFDAYRSLKMREQPGSETKHQFVTTSADNMLFGHGTHACPGRFFASTEIKTLFCFLLLQYDWRYEPGYVPPKDLEIETFLLVPDVKVQCQKREAEIDLMNPKEVK